jgi:hypothetical protein
MNEGLGNAKSYRHGQEDQQKHENPGRTALGIMVAFITVRHACQFTPAGSSSFLPS